MSRLLQHPTEKSLSIDMRQSDSRNPWQFGIQDQKAAKQMSLYAIPTWQKKEEFMRSLKISHGHSGVSSDSVGPGPNPIKTNCSRASQEYTTPHRHHIHFETRDLLQTPATIQTGPVTHNFRTSHSKCVGTYVGSFKLENVWLRSVNSHSCRDTWRSN